MRGSHGHRPLGVGGGGGSHQMFFGMRRKLSFLVVCCGIALLFLLGYQAATHSSYPPQEGRTTTGGSTPQTVPAVHDVEDETRAHQKTAQDHSNKVSVANSNSQQHSSVGEAVMSANPNRGGAAFDEQSTAIGKGSGDDGSGDKTPPTDNLHFTIVMLTYKAPKSLKYSLDSFEQSGLLYMPQLQEVIIYFQALQDKDRTMVESWFNGYRNKAQEEEEAAAKEEIPVGGSEGNLAGVGGANRKSGRHVLLQRRGKLARYRVIGTAGNHPVAKATFEALRQVKTEYVLYLECDRPIYPFTNFGQPKEEQKEPGNADGGDVAYLQQRVEATILTALSLVSQDKAQLFRLQLYAGPEVFERSPHSGKGILHPDIYGSDTHRNCLKAHSLTAEHCAQAKRKYGRVYNTAYCKHWKKFANNKYRPQSDLCDSFCFVDWVNEFHNANGTNRYAKAKVDRGVFSVVAVGGAKENTKKASAIKVEYYCLTSDECNFTNQPSLYRKEWYLQQLAAPCEANPKHCLGAPGRGSAVRQEQFYLKNQTAWGKRKFSICLTRGLFYHHERFQESGKEGAMAAFRRMCASLGMGVCLGASTIYMTGTNPFTVPTAAAFSRIEEPQDLSPSTGLNVLQRVLPTAHCREVQNEAKTYDEISEKIYKHVKQEYDDLGQLEFGEEVLTVLPNVFAQMGILTFDGVRQMLNQFPMTAKDVFCDIGSGVGNICLQVLHDSDVQSVVGVEVIPSRHRHAVAAIDTAKKFFPEKFAPKEAHFTQQDLIDSANYLREHNVSVIFSHSWMFDEPLMEQFGNMIMKVDSLRTIITSKPFPERLKGDLAAKGLALDLDHPLVHLAADWNDQSEFYVYVRHPDWTPQGRRKATTK